VPGCKRPETGQGLTLQGAHDRAGKDLSLSRSVEFQGAVGGVDKARAALGRRQPAGPPEDREFDARHEG
jgi:hypothetical protein